MSPNSVPETVPDRLAKRLMPTIVVMRRWIICGVVSLAIGTGYMVHLLANQRANTGHVEQAVCAVVAYADEQSLNIEERANQAKPQDRANLDASAHQLRLLADRMRQTRVRCPARPTAPPILP